MRSSRWQVFGQEVIRRWRGFNCNPDGNSDVQLATALGNSAALNRENRNADRASSGRVPVDQRAVVTIEQDYRAMKAASLPLCLDDRRKWKQATDMDFSRARRHDRIRLRPAGRRYAVPRLPGMARPGAEAWPINLHHITNIAVDVDGDRSRSAAHFTARWSRPAPGGGRCDHQRRLLSRHAWSADATGPAHRGAVYDITIQIGGLPPDYCHSGLRLSLNYWLSSPCRQDRHGDGAINTCKYYKSA